MAAPRAGYHVSAERKDNLAVLQPGSFPSMVGIPD
jgi:hypothetical protein